MPKCIITQNPLLGLTDAHSWIPLWFYCMRGKNQREMWTKPGPVPPAIASNYLWYLIRAQKIQCKTPQPKSISEPSPLLLRHHRISPWENISWLQILFHCHFSRFFSAHSVLRLLILIIWIMRNLFSCFSYTLSLSLLPLSSVMLLDTTESTSELGWTTYPDTGVSTRLGCWCVSPALRKPITCVKHMLYVVAFRVLACDHIVCDRHYFPLWLINRLVCKISGNSDKCPSPFPEWEGKLPYD